MKWLKDINVGSKPLTSDLDFDDAVSQLKTAKCDVPSIDTAFQSLPFTKVGDEIKVNDARFRDLEAKFRKGEIRDAFDDAKVSTTISKADESTLREVIKEEAPDVDIKEMKTKTDQAKKYHEDLAVTAKTGEELEGKLSDKSKEKTKSIYSKIIAGVAVGTTVAGLFTAMAVSGKMYDDIVDANNSRNGCFLVYKNTNSIACKLPSRSCGYGNKGAVPCSSDYRDKTSYNINLMLNDMFITGNNTAIEAIKTLGVVFSATPDDTSTYTAEYALNQPDNIPILTKYMKDNFPTVMSATYDPCTTANIEIGCVACDTTAPTNSAKFTSTAMLDGNMTFVQIEDSTVIDTLTDIATTLGVDIFSASGDSISGSFQGNFFMTMVIVLVLVSAIAFALHFLKGKGKKTNNARNTPGMVDSQMTGMNAPVMTNYTNSMGNNMGMRGGPPTAVPNRVAANPNRNTLIM